MSNRLVVSSLVLALVGCGSVGDEAPGSAIPADSSAAALAPGPPTTPDSGGVAVAAADTTLAQAAAVDSGSAAADDAQALDDVRIELLLARQETVLRRLDSLSTLLASTDTTLSAAASGEVLGEAGQRVRSFGVGIAWTVLVLALFSVVVRSVVWLLDALAERSARRRLFYKRLVPIVRIVLWAFAAYLIVSVIFRVDAQGIFAAAAAIGVAIGFAAQDLLKNLFGGLILVFDQPFQVGDKVTVGGTYGEVVSIGLRSTRIVTADDNRVSVPNAQVVDQQVANANAGELNCQVVTDLYLPGWVDESVAKRIAFEAAASSQYVYLNKPIVVLVSDVFKETFLTRVRVKAYVLDPRLEFLFQSEVTERARAGFREAGLLRPEHMRRGLVRRSAAGDAAETVAPPGSPNGG